MNWIQTSDFYYDTAAACIQYLFSLVFISPSIVLKMITFVADRFIAFLTSNHLLVKEYCDMLVYRQT